MRWDCEFGSRVPRPSILDRVIWWVSVIGIVALTAYAVTTY